MLINKRFAVDSARGEVTDRETGAVSRLEPRLMKLLCLLAENRGKLVSRQVIIKDLWDDYPGGDDGLTQAISGLRHLLHDDQKQLIETMPKKGYYFNGRVEPVGSVEPVGTVEPVGSGATVAALSGPVAKKMRPRAAYVAGGIVLVLLITIAWRYYQRHQENYTGGSSREESIRLYKLDSARKAERMKNEFRQDRR
jgi:DNA-binding winged helix-turn-helix (wHTH) protein